MQNSSLFTVKKEQLQTVTGLITDHYGIIREDTNKVLGIFKKGYQFHQPEETLDLMKKLGGKIDAQLTTKYIIDGGKRIAFQLELAEARIADDVVQNYITALDSFDGSTSLCFGYSNKVMSCQNQFFAVKHQLGKQNKIRHTVSMFAKIEEIISRVSIIKAQNLVYTENFKRWTSTSVSKELAVNAVIEALDIDRKADMSPQTKSKMDLLMYGIEKEMKEKGRTKWGLFNGFTYYTNHLVENKDTQSSLISGSLGTFNQKTFRIVEELV